MATITTIRVVDGIVDSVATDYEELVTVIRYEDSSEVDIFVGDKLVVEAQ